MCYLSCRHEHRISYVPQCIPVFHHRNHLLDFDVKFLQIVGNLFDNVFHVAVVLPAHLRPVAVVVVVPVHIPPRRAEPVG